MATADSTPIQLPLAIDGLTVEIRLTKGYVTIVDAVDVDLIQFKWQATEASDGTVYANRKRKTNRTTVMFYLHRVILERVLGRPLAKGDLCDHEDLNTLNNRRGNLRLATWNGNASNRKRQPNNTSGYKGVTFDKQTGKWRAQIQHKSKHIAIGRFDTPELAYEAYCNAAREYFGEFARLE